MANVYHGDHSGLVIDPVDDPVSPAPRAKSRFGYDSAFTQKTYVHANDDVQSFGLVQRACP